MLVIQERNRSNVFHQLSFLCLQIHKTCSTEFSKETFSTADHDYRKYKGKAGKITKRGVMCEFITPLSLIYV